MDLCPFPTLQNLTVKRILISLWNSTKIKRFIENRLYEIFYESVREWERIEQRIIFHLRQLPLPKNIEKEFADDIRPIGLELLAWIEFHFMHVRIKPKIPDKFFWTPLGTINLRKTAKILVKEKSLERLDRYKLACAFCFESSIRELWQKVKTMVILKLNLQSEESERKMLDEEYGLTIFWTYYNCGRIDELDMGYIKSNRDRQSVFQLRIWRFRKKVSPWECGFRCSIESANATAASYFYKKLNADERKKTYHIIVTHSPMEFLGNDWKWKKGYFLKKYCFDIFLSSFRDLDEAQKRICQNYKRNNCGYSRSHQNYYCQELYLAGFLDWPFQAILLDTAVSIWNSPHFDDANITYGIFLIDLLQKILYGYTDYDYIQLFKDFWEAMPPSRKRQQTIDWCKYRIKTDLHKFADTNNISVIFKDETLNDSYHFPADSADGIQFFDDDRSDIYSMNDQHALLAHYILACVCEEDIIVNYLEYHKNRVSNFINKNLNRRDFSSTDAIGQWSDFFECLNEFIEHEPAEKNLERIYHCPGRKTYMIQAKWEIERLYQNCVR